jgi:hypothetical protein
VRTSPAVRCAIVSAGDNVPNGEENRQVAMVKPLHSFQVFCSHAAVVVEV